MFEKTQKAATEFSQAVTEDTNNAVTMVKAMVVPTIAGVFGSLASYANKVKEGVESGEFLNRAKAAVTEKAPAEKTADPLPTEEENVMIRAMRKAGVSDEMIAKSLNLSVLTVKMAI